MQVTELLAAHGGVATHRQLHSSGRSALERAVTAGAVVRIARGVYALPSAPTTLQVAAALHGVVSHTSAAQLWFLEVVTAPERPHVLLPRGARRPDDCGAQLHWADLPPADVRSGVTAPVRTVVDCARDLPLPEALAVADSALRRGLVTEDELRARAGALRGAGRKTVLRVVAAADARAANPFESALRGIVLGAGLTGFTPQLPVSAGAVRARVDLGDELLRIALEADSFTWHGDREALASDCRRYDELVAAGWLVLRFAWEHVMFHPYWVARVVLDTVALRTDGCAPRRSRALALHPVGRAQGPAEVPRLGSSALLGRLR